ncbi:GyrI-like domain-containing protein [Pseudoxanthomonas sp. NC8]|nr:GyrI-like domain-containing protein [Pseudoxanthomonas sp. NC8]
MALDAGYSTPEAFSRAFQRTLGQSPSGFRESPDWMRWHDTFATLDLREPVAMAAYADQLRILDTPDIAVALLEHRGDPRLIGDSLRRFIGWRRAQGLSPARSRTFNVFHTPEDVDPAEFRMDLCAATELPVAANAEGVVAGVLRGGRVAVVRHRGGDAALAEVFRWLYAEWLPASGEVLRDAPPYLERLSLHPDVPQQDAEWQAFLPLAPR